MPFNKQDGSNATSGPETQYAAAAVVIGALVFLILIRRGFRGVGLPGVGSVRVA